MGQIRLGKKPPLTVGPQDTVVKVARAMTERHVGAATVINGDAILGVVSERDIMQKIVAPGRDPNGTLARDIMTSPVISVQMKTSVTDAAELMRKHHVRHLVVVDENEKLVGMLALRYVLYDLMADMQRNVGDLIGFIMTDSPGG